MKNFAMTFFAMALLLATLEADGKRLAMEKDHQLGRKADVGAKDDKNPTANRGVATGRTAEDNSAVGLLDSQEENDLSSSQTTHHYYTNKTNPYAPRLVPLKDSKTGKP
ncbi:uncharacterized protein LOC111307531 [Durio zibethinus]|uniref:Uncharacterized protein LOC111307531 n=1 Tax=Durio zibethinus TaxID=66656 RepID=A0A6P6A8S2_DURZI|nr:uncharacterized protein LOC111307531 [Durio zibethinus]